MEPPPDQPLEDRSPICEALKECVGWCAVCNQPTSNLPFGDLAAITKHVPRIPRTELILNENDPPVWTSEACEIRKTFWNDKEVVLKKYFNKDRLAEDTQIYTWHQDIYVLKLYGIVIEDNDGADVAGTLVFQYAEKGNLRDFIGTEEVRSMAFQDIARIGYEIANGLDFLHTFLNRTHGALTSENILIDCHGKVNMIGFGRGQPSETSAPSQTANDRDVESIRTAKQQDIYDLGVVLLELGVRESFRESIDKVKVTQALEHLKKATKTPPRYTDLIARCFSTDLRHQSSIWDIIDTLNTLYHADNLDALKSDNVFDAVRAGNVAALEWFLSQGGDPNSEEFDESGSGKPLICLICEQPRPAALLSALFQSQKGKNCNVNARHTFHVGRRFYINCPIFQVIRGEEPYRSLEVLSKNGANLDTTDKRGRSIVHAICERFKSDTASVVQMLDLLIQHRYNFDQPNDNGLREPALHEIAHYYPAPLEPMRFLVSKGAADIHTQSWHGTVLHTIAHYCERSLDVAKWLVDDQKLDVNAPNQEKMKPLQLAVMRRGQMEIVKFLISKGASVFDRFQSFAKLGGRTDVLSLAAKKGTCILPTFSFGREKQPSTYGLH
ncbi:kinase-like domain-containing protein [Jimgerdemannia flammicorona]|uniref:Kinase-like domain-containing protein n=1 Tax=Jimgerdemannia flammicorona TaxID=994334 RepID=A0A433Q1R4_9FUNG|nr:kinase-like domain-containing protein [Jimgerdemannia flammicorona]